MSTPVAVSDNHPDHFDDNDVDEPEPFRGTPVPVDPADWAISEAAAEAARAARAASIVSFGSSSSSDQVFPLPPTRPLPPLPVAGLPLLPGDYADDSDESDEGPDALPVPDGDDDLGYDDGLDHDHHDDDDVMHDEAEDPLSDADPALSSSSRTTSPLVAPPYAVAPEWPAVDANGIPVPLDDALPDDDDDDEEDDGVLVDHPLFAPVYMRPGSVRPGSARPGSARSTTPLSVGSVTAAVPAAARGLLRTPLEPVPDDADTDDVDGEAVQDLASHAHKSEQEDALDNDDDNISDRSVLDNSPSLDAALHLAAAAHDNDPDLSPVPLTYDPWLAAALDPQTDQPPLFRLALHSLQAHYQSNMDRLREHAHRRLSELARQLAAQAAELARLRAASTAAGAVGSDADTDSDVDSSVAEDDQVDRACQTDLTPDRASNDLAALVAAMDAGRDHASGDVLRLAAALQEAEEREAQLTAEQARDHQLVRELADQVAALQAECDQADAAAEEWAVRCREAEARVEEVEQRCAEAEQRTTAAQERAGAAEELAELAKLDAASAKERLADVEMQLGQLQAAHDEALAQLQAQTELTPPADPVDRLARIEDENARLIAQVNRLRADAAQAEALHESLQDIMDECREWKQRAKTAAARCAELEAALTTGAGVAVTTDGESDTAVALATLEAENAHLRAELVRIQDEAAAQIAHLLEGHDTGSSTSSGSVSLVDIPADASESSPTLVADVGADVGGVPAVVDRTSWLEAEVARLQALVPDLTAAAHAADAQLAEMHAALQDVVEQCAEWRRKAMDAAQRCSELERAATGADIGAAVPDVQRAPSPLTAADVPTVVIDPPAVDPDASAVFSTASSSPPASPRPASELDRVRARNDWLETEQVVLCRRVTDLQEAARAYETQVNELRESLEDVVDECRIWKQRAIEAARSSISAGSARPEDQARVEELERENARLRTQMADLESVATQAAQAITALHEQFDSTVEGHQAQLDDMHAALAMVAAERADWAQRAIKAACPDLAPGPVMLESVLPDEGRSVTGADASDRGESLTGSESRRGSSTRSNAGSVLDTEDEVARLRAQIAELEAARRVDVDLIERLQEAIQELDRAHQCEVAELRALVPPSQSHDGKAAMPQLEITTVVDEGREPSDQVVTPSDRPSTESDLLDLYNVSLATTTSLLAIAEDDHDSGAVPPVAPAADETDHDALAQENDRLRARIADFDARIAADADRIAHLQARVERAELDPIAVRNVWLESENAALCRQVAELQAAVRGSKLHVRVPVDDGDEDDDVPTPAIGGQRALDDDETATPLSLDAAPGTHLPDPESPPRSPRPKTLTTLDLPAHDASSPDVADDHDHHRHLDGGRGSESTGTPEPPGAEHPPPPGMILIEAEQIVGLRAIVEKAEATTQIMKDMAARNAWLEAENHALELQVSELQDAIAAARQREFAAVSARAMHDDAHDTTASDTTFSTNTSSEPDSGPASHAASASPLAALMDENQRLLAKANRLEAKVLEDADCVAALNDLIRAQADHIADIQADADRVAELEQQIMRNEAEFEDQTWTLTALLEVQQVAAAQQIAAAEEELEEVYARLEKAVAERDEWRRRVAVALEAKAELKEAEAMIARQVRAVEDVEEVSVQVAPDADEGKEGTAANATEDRDAATDVGEDQHTEPETALAEDVEEPEHGNAGRDADELEELGSDLDPDIEEPEPLVPITDEDLAALMLPKDREIERLETLVHDKDRAINDLRDSISQHEQALADLRAKLADTESRATQETERAAKLQDDAQRLWQTVQDLIDDQAGWDETMGQALEDQRVEFATRETQILDQVAHWKNKHDQLAERVDEVHVLLRDAVVGEEEVNSSEEPLSLAACAAAIIDRVTELSDAKNALADRVRDVEREADELAQHVVQLQDAARAEQAGVEELRAALNRAVEEGSEWMGRAQDAADRVQAQQQDLAALAARATDLEHEIAAWDVKHRDTVSAHAAEIADLEHELTLWDAKHRDAVAAHAAEIAEWRAELDQVRTQMAEAQRVCEQAEQERDHFAALIDAGHSRRHKSPSPVHGAAAAGAARSASPWAHLEAVARERDKAVEALEVTRRTMADVVQERDEFVSSLARAHAVLEEQGATLDELRAEVVAARRPQSAPGTAAWDRSPRAEVSPFSRSMPTIRESLCADDGIRTGPMQGVGNISFASTGQLESSASSIVFHSQQPQHQHQHDSPSTNPPLVDPRYTRTSGVLDPPSPAISTFLRADADAVPRTGSAQRVSSRLAHLGSDPDTSGMPRLHTALEYLCTEIHDRDLQLMECDHIIDVLRRDLRGVQDQVASSPAPFVVPDTPPRRAAARSAPPAGAAAGAAPVARQGPPPSAAAQTAVRQLVRALFQLHRQYLELQIDCDALRGKLHAQHRAGPPGARVLARIAALVFQKQYLMHVIEEHQHEDDLAWNLVHSLGITRPAPLAPSPRRRLRATVWAIVALRRWSVGLPLDVDVAPDTPAAPPVRPWSAHPAGAPKVVAVPARSNSARPAMMMDDEDDDEGGYAWAGPRAGAAHEMQMHDEGRW
ncbi:hypothetical protein GGF31_005072 [Allomyces arbusculus]|nr:hypothetical protein GGF31_005072 [Allomyces arbusculus]